MVNVQYIYRVNTGDESRRLRVKIDDHAAWVGKTLDDEVTQVLEIDAERGIVVLKNTETGRRRYYNDVPVEE